MAGNLLQDFVANYLAREKRFRWGQDDCSIGLVSEWVKVRTGIDFAETFRHSYRSREEAMTIIDQRGGWEKMLDDLFRPAGVERTNDPMTGDIGVIKMGEGVMAIRMRNLWGVRAVHGIGATESGHIAAWRIP